MEPIFHPQATHDAREIEKQYADISQELANRFWTDLNEALNHVFDFPERQYFDPSGYRRRNLKKFPYHILFEQRLDCVRVIVIRHHHRKPSFGMRRR